MIKIPCGKFNNVRFDIDAPNNGEGIVYHVSDCSPGYVRSYCCGGAGPGLYCGTHLLTNDMLIAVWTKKPCGLFPVPIGNAPYDYNWSINDLLYKWWYD